MQPAPHYYDIHQPLAAPDVLADVSASGVDAMARDLCTYCMVAEQAASPRPVDGFAASPAFNNGPHVPIAGAVPSEEQRTRSASPLSRSGARRGAEHIDWSDSWAWPSGGARHHHTDGTLHHGRKGGGHPRRPVADSPRPVAGRHRYGDAPILGSNSIG